MKDEQNPDAPPPSPAEQVGAKAEDRPRLRLRSLKVHAFRDIRPGTELHFGKGAHLILGKNGTGKSTLLELLAAVSTLNFRRPFFAETPFHVEASFKVGHVLLHAEFRRDFDLPHMGSEGSRIMDLPLSERAEVTIRLEQPSAGFCQWIRARSGEPVRVFDADPRRDDAKPTLPTWWTMAGNDPLGLSVIMVIGFGAMVAKDDSLGVHPEVMPTVLALVDRNSVTAPFDEALGVLQIVTGHGVSVSRGDKIRSASAWFPMALDFAATGEPVALDLDRALILKNVVERLGYDEARAYFGPGASTNMGWIYSSPSFQFFRKGKAIRRHDQLSFGQKRLFSFAWYLACNPDVAIADELVNGLHADWIDWCVEALADRQCFLTSQNPLLVDEMTFASDEDLRRGIILCEAVHDAERDTTELVWRQLDDRETSLIAGALQKSRLDLLSDLLRALDLW